MPRWKIVLNTAFVFLGDAIVARFLALILNSIASQCLVVMRNYDVQL